MISIKKLRVLYVYGGFILEYNYYSKGIYKIALNYKNKQQKTFNIDDYKNKQNKNIMQKLSKVDFYQDTVKFDSVETELNVSQDYIEMKLARLYEDEPTRESLWCSVLNNDVYCVYKFTYGKGLEQTL